MVVGAGRRRSPAYTARVKLKINGETTESAAGRLTVADLIASRPCPSGACAVEINRRLAPRREWPTTELSDGDEIEIVTLVGGG